MGELLNESKELLGLGQKRQQRPRHLEFSTDPVTGFRSNKGTYSGERGGKRKEMDKSKCSELDSCSFDGELNFLRAWQSTDAALFFKYLRVHIAIAPIPCQCIWSLCASKPMILLRYQPKLHMQNILDFVILDWDSLRSHSILGFDLISAT